MEEFGDHYHMVSITTPDFESTTGLRRKWGYRAAEVVKMIETFVNSHLGPTRQFDLVIHDWGCTWGFRYTENNPTRVRKTMAVGPWLVIGV